jgi:sigma-54 dependent transcriptional regulator, acetoin dehydrogenase operon transcriptional activator AcoR
VCVQGAEHFFDDVRAMHCAAAPIRDVRGRLAGVLDISSESIPFSFDVASVVGLYAGAIENRLLIAQAGEHLILRLQVAPSLLDSPMAGLIGIDTSGRLVWRNAVASRLLGLPPAEQQDISASVETALGARISELASLPRSEAAALKLPNGLMVWARSEMRAPDGHRLVFPAFPTVQPHEPARLTASEPRPSESAPVPVATDDGSDASPPEAKVAADGLSTLRDSDRDLIARTLVECGGNVSEAARKLGVSRGLVYRRLQGQSSVLNRNNSHARDNPMYR